MAAKRREAELQLQIQTLKQEAAATTRSATRSLAQARVLASANASHMEVHVCLVSLCGIPLRLLQTTDRHHALD